MVMNIFSRGFLISFVYMNMQRSPKCELPQEEMIEETVASLDWSTLFNDTNTVIGILLSIITGVGVIYGLRYIRTMKEKHILGTFSFWSQINVRIIRLFNMLSEDKRILNNMYSKEKRIRWENNNAPASKVNMFKELARETIEYLEKTTDQMPAYIGWSEDFSEFMNFLAHVEQYSIDDPNNNFVDDNDKILGDRDLYWENICRTMQKLINGIIIRQNDIEREIFHVSVIKQIWLKLKDEISEC